MLALDHNGQIDDTMGSIIIGKSVQALKKCMVAIKSYLHMA